MEVESKAVVGQTPGFERTLPMMEALALIRTKISPFRHTTPIGPDVALPRLATKIAAPDAQSLAAAKSAREFGDLDPDNVLGVKALGPFAELEFNLFPVFQGFVPITLNSGVVDEYIALLPVFQDEAVPLCVVEPLDLSLCHMIPRKT